MLNIEHDRCIVGTGQISSKYNLIYVITKLGLLFVYDLETATAVYRNRISPDPIFLTVDAPTTGGFYAVNRRGQVLLATVNESTIVPFVSNQVSNLVNKCTFFFFLPWLSGDVCPVHISFGMIISNELQLNNLELAVNLARRGNLPGAEGLVCSFFHAIHLNSHRSL